MKGSANGAVWQNIICKISIQLAATKKQIFRLFYTHTADKTVDMAEMTLEQFETKAMKLPEVDQNKSAGVVGRNQLTEGTQRKADYTH